MSSFFRRQYRLFVWVALLLAFASRPGAAQNTLEARVLDAHEREPIPGVNVLLEGTEIGGVTGADGRVSITSIPDGTYTVAFTFIGYRAHRMELTFPREQVVIEVLLDEQEIELGETTVTAVRSSRTIADIPTRVEVIGGEEIEEKIAMDPSGISMLLNESPGIVVQQTSAVSASASFRIQGLGGEYTQLLRDGFPLYGGLAGGLSLLQIPPLDLAQVEVIKGPASTLYGGDAIAGLVQLVSKRPTEAGERSLLVNTTTAGGLDAALYLAGRDARTGYTLLASANFQKAYDAEEDDFTNLPSTRRLTVSPTWYRYGKGMLTLRLSTTLEDREGGDMAAVRADRAGFTEHNRSGRVSVATGYERPLPSGTSLVLRSSGSVFGRSVAVPGFRFAGRQLASYTEASAHGERGAHEWVGGVDLRTDAFTQTDGEADPLDYAYGSVGLFGQDTWSLGQRVALESGLRLDLHNEFGAFLLPRAALLFKHDSGLAARVGGGLGYKAPTPFVEEAEARSFRGVRPVADSLDAERSVGANVDVNYGAVVGPFALSLNQAVYVTRVNHAASLGDGAVVVRGSESTARISRGDLKLFLGYVYLVAEEETRGQTSALPLTAQHRTYTVLVWEQHGRGRVGLEAYYTGRQPLPDGGSAPGYLITGIMTQWRFGSVRAFLNLENLLDARQSRTSPLVTGPRTNPTFPPIWGPTDGFIANGGVILDL
jgi:iron complex outermembrane receptor protein